MIENDLGRALRAHRQDCGDCAAGRACPAYLDIARRLTETRVIREGPVMSYQRLSVREATSA